MQTEIRFTCPECGQHYTAEPAWQGLPLTCSACQSRFEVRALPAPLVPEASAAPAVRVRALAAIPDRPGRPGPHQLRGTLWACATPPALAAIALPCVFVPRPLGSAGMLAAGAGVVYASHRFAKWYLEKWGRDALEYYIKSACTLFVVLPAVGVAVFLSVSEEGAGLLIFPVTVGFYLASIVLAAAWLVGAKWFGPGR